MQVILNLTYCADFDNDEPCASVLCSGRKRYVEDFAALVAGIPEHGVRRSEDSDCQSTIQIAITVKSWNNIVNIVFVLADAAVS